jgi:hypothetical protein
MERRPVWNAVIFAVSFTFVMKAPPPLSDQEVLGLVGSKSPASFPRNQSGARRSRHFKWLIAR